MASVFSDAATVNAPLALAGEAWHASALSFPAATATNTPAFHRLVVASFSAWESPPPSDMFATAGLAWFCRTQSIPAMIWEVSPIPAQLSTRTPCSDTLLATPYVAPPMIPDTCVPWPLQSSPVAPYASYTLSVRPPKSDARVEIPVSMM